RPPRLAQSAARTIHGLSFAHPFSGSNVGQTGDMVGKLQHDSPERARNQACCCGMRLAPKGCQEEGGCGSARWAMAGSLCVNESPTEYFKGMVESAMEHQHVAANELTSFYVVNLLAGFARNRRPLTDSEEPLGVRFVRALQSAGPRQREGLREIGDLS